MSDRQIKRAWVFAFPVSLALVLALFPIADMWAAVVSPTTPPTSGYAQIGDEIGPIVADGTTTPFRLKKITGDHKTGWQIFGTWDGAAVTGQMRLCQTVNAGAVACTWVTMPNTTWPVSSDTILGSVQSYGPATEFRLSVATVGASTSLWWVIRQ